MTTSLTTDFLLTLSKRYGLPLFVYDTDVISGQIQKLRSAFDVPKLELRYASKALNTTSILKHIYERGCGIDCVSPGEIK